MSFNFNTALRNTRVGAIAADIDKGTTNPTGTIRLYDGVKPAAGGAATTLLAELGFQNPSFPAASGGSMTANAITSEASAPAAGVATWARIVDRDGAFVMDGVVAVSGADVSLDNTTIALGQTVNGTVATFNDGNA